MKKINRATLCYGVGGILFLAFLVHTAVDYVRYNDMLTAAPFSVWILVNGICFTVPAMIALAVGLVIRKKQNSTTESPLD